MHMQLWQSIPFACIILPLGTLALGVVIWIRRRHL